MTPEFDTGGLSAKMWHKPSKDHETMAIVAAAAAKSGRHRSGGRIRLSSTLILGSFLAVVSIFMLLAGTATITSSEGDDADKHESATSLRSRTATANARRRVPPSSENAADTAKIPSAAAASVATREDITHKRASISNPDATNRTSFPPPSQLASSSAQVMLRPTRGVHNPEADAVFGFAEGYRLNTCVGFVESLKATGYRGDVVLSVSSTDRLATGVQKYLDADHGDINLVYYAIDWACWKKNGDKISAKGGRTTTNYGFSDCQINGLYGDGSQVFDDPRQPRPVATARYELYWIFCLRYAQYSRILLIDVRDTYFQRSPFEDLPLTTDNGDGSGRSGGILRLYEENATPSSAAANVGASNYNSRWIRGAYGQAALSQIKHQPVICSGSTIGDAVAIEAYLRAMVAQFDTTQCKQVGCDQGMHNYLYYSKSLEGVEGIGEVITYKQGEGVVNNLAAMRNSPLRQQGVLVDDKVINWDKSISAVAHQYDRDKELERLVKDRINIMITGLDIS